MKTQLSPNSIDAEKMRCRTQLSLLSKTFRGEIGIGQWNLEFHLFEEVVFNFFSIRLRCDDQHRPSIGVRIGLGIEKPLPGAAARHHALITRSQFQRNPKQWVGIFLAFDGTEIGEGPWWNLPGFRFRNPVGHLVDGCAISRLAYAVAALFLHAWIVRRYWRSFESRRDEFVVALTEHDMDFVRTRIVKELTPLARFTDVPDEDAHRILAVLVENDILAHFLGRRQLSSGNNSLVGIHMGPFFDGICRKFFDFRDVE